jgi:hypothetical protein
MYNQIWKDIIGYEGLYQVSNLGLVKSLPKQKIRKSRFGNYYTITTKEIILKNVEGKTGYNSVTLVKNSIKKTINIHRIQLIAFKPNSDFKNLQVNHIDGNKRNNNLENLEWTTPIENTRHAHKNNLCQKGITHHASRQLICTKTGNIYESITDAKNKLNIHNIGAMLIGKRKNKTTLKYI